MQYLFCWKILIIKSMNTIAVKIKELRKSLNLTQKEFCERVGISQGYLSALEKNPERSNCLIRFLYYTSMRIHQALSLTWSNVLWEQEVITIKRKGRKEHYQFPIICFSLLKAPMCRQKR